ncbi:MAG: hypothetical protein AB1442_06705 [Nitrospirota bacterium]
MRSRVSFIPILSMGFTSMLLQITVIRLLLSTFFGNELDIGITLSFWLLFMALGSYAGRRIRFRHAFSLSFLLIGLLILPTALAIKAIKPALSLEPGETVSLIHIIASTVVTLLPVCFVLGLQFPLAISFSGERNTAGRIYGIEAAGAFAAGIVFTFFFASRIDAYSLCLGLSIFNILIGASVSGRRALAFLLALPLLFYFATCRSTYSLPWKGLEIAGTVESRYGEITVVRVGEQSSVYGSGQLLFTYPDKQEAELKAHLAMSLHPSPSRILVIGGSPEIVFEILKYPVSRVDFVELDPKVIRIALDLLTHEDRKAMDRPDLTFVVQDGRLYLKNIHRPMYDLVLLNLPPPATAGINRFYTLECFREARKTLNDDGILALPVPSSSGYIGRSLQTANGAVYNSLRSVFPHVVLTAQEYGYFFAGNREIDTSVGLLETRFRKRGVPASHFSEYQFRDIFPSFGLDYVRQRLGEIKAVNTDLRPAAYLYNLMLWSEVHGGESLKQLLGIRGMHMAVIAAAVMLILAPLIFRRRNRTVYYSVFAMGFSGMTLTITIMLAFQAFYGYIYEMIGLMSSTFMIGIWSGTRITGRMKNALGTLLILEILTCVLAVSAPLLFKSEFLFYTLVFAAGVLSGGRFTAAGLLIPGADAGGKLYALDLSGSFLGAFIPAIMVIPLLGIPYALVSVATVTAFSAMMILSLTSDKLMKIRN